MVTTGMVAGALACAGGSLLLGAFLWWVHETEGTMATVVTIGCLFLAVAFVMDGAPVTENEVLVLCGFVLPVLCALGIIWLICRPTFSSRVPSPPPRRYPRGHVLWTPTDGQREPWPGPRA